jgi:hypothetical protein
MTHRVYEEGGARAIAIISLEQHRPDGLFEDAVGVTTLTRDQSRVSDPHELNRRSAKDPRHRVLPKAGPVVLEERNNAKSCS